MRGNHPIIAVGYNVTGTEIEDALLQHLAVSKCAAVDIADADRGTVVKAFVAIRPAQAAQALSAVKLTADSRAIGSTAVQGKARRCSFLAMRRPHDDPVQPPDWTAPKSYANGILARGSTLLFVSGQIG